MDKLLILDLHGTLINSKHILPSELKDTLNSLTGKYSIIINSSAPHCEIEQFLKINSLNLNYACHSGALVYYNDLVINNSFTINLKSLKAFDEDIIHLIYTKDNLNYVYKYSPKINFLVSKYANNTIDIKNLQDINEIELFEAYLVITQTSKNILISFLQTKGINAIILGEDKQKCLLRLLKANVNKGSFINDLKETFSVNYIISVGDSEEDLSFFKQANFKVATKNASIKLKEVADIVLQSDNLLTFLKFLLNNS